MAMNLKFDGGDTEYEVVPKGEHKAICYRVVDAGTAEEEYQGEKSNKHKIFLFWELKDLLMEDGRPMSIFAQYTASLNEKSNLYKAAMAWMNRGFTDEEKQGFDPSMFVGKGCKLAVDHTVNGRAKVTALLTAVEAFDANEELKSLPTKNEQAREQVRIAQEIEHSKASKKAQTMWDEAKPCDLHPYLETKKVQSYGLKQYNDALVIPAYNRDFAVQTLQFIGPDGQKRFLRGGKKKGGFFCIGKEHLDTAHIINYAEGYATAASYHEHRKEPVIVSFDAGNLPHVADVIF